MTVEVLLAALALVAAAIPAVLTLRNLSLYDAGDIASSMRLDRRPACDEHARQAVSVLIPARNEEATIERSVRAVLASELVRLEVIVLDDHSTDRTRELVAAIAAQDTRLSLAEAPALPPGWCGKQHACHRLAQLATHPVRVFIDADVVLEPRAICQAVAELRARRVHLISGFPRQITIGPLERLLIPLIHFVLLGFLPLWRMRRSRDAAYAAGCGQFMMVREAAYRAVGGHAMIRDSLHDGLNLPRAFRRAGFATDLLDLTGLASCRMYRSAADVWSGLGKNAIEGLGHPRIIVPMTLLLTLGQILPFVLAPLGLAGRLEPTAFGLALAACACAWLPRALMVRRFRQPLDGAVLHPIGIALLLLIQWSALSRSLRRRPSVWKGRQYPATAGGVTNRRVDDESSSIEDG